MSTTAFIEALRNALPERYLVEGEHKSGGQGSVFRGRYDDQPAALKIFKPSDDIRRIHREIDLLREIDCPNLIKVLATEKIMIDGTNLELIAYEFHPGGDLSDTFAPGAPHLPEDELVRIGHEIGTAVDLLWEKRVVHRDIKPANIVRAADGRYVLVDVGFACQLDRSTLTAPGLAVGTVGYMSPEQARGRRNLTIHSDAFSLGLTLFEVACKVHPFSRDQRIICSGRGPTSMRSLRPDLSTGFSSAVHRMMSSFPALRPRSLAMHFSSL